jgi:uncharacterized membrane protein YgaE (UPF0421/DUF939 family)
MVTAGSRGHHTAEAVSEMTQRSKAGLVDRWRRTRGSLLLAAQAGLAAGIAWLAAQHVIGHPHPFFAPIAAVIVLNVSVGQRLRRAVELVFGVALGILVGDLLIYFIGSGVWQIGVSVAFTILAAVFFGGSPTVIGQAASSAVLVTTLAPPQAGIYYSRFLDALVGGVVGVLVLALLLQLNPLTLIRRAARPAFDCLAEGLGDCARALAAGSQEDAQAALDALRDAESSISRFNDALADARETATLAPVRWRARVPLTEYVDAAPHIDHALRNARVLARRTVAAIEDGEEAPPLLIAALQGSSEAVATFVAELAAGREPERTRQLTLVAVAAAGEAYRGGLCFSTGVIVAQVRTIGTDLLLATGLPDHVVTTSIRRAVGPVPGPPGRPARPASLG